MEKRVYNFNAGPAVLPEEVLAEAQRDFMIYPGAGMSVMEMSHRSKEFDKIINEAKADLKTLLDIPDNYQILFLQGGATLQFSMIPLNLMPTANKADYIVTGSWSKKAVKEAKELGLLILPLLRKMKTLHAYRNRTSLNWIPKHPMFIILQTTLYSAPNLKQNRKSEMFLWFVTLLPICFIKK